MTLQRLTLCLLLLVGLSAIPALAAGRPHGLVVTPACDPTILPSGGTTSCTVERISDTWDHGVEPGSLLWDDGGAGGTFSPSADVESPTYTAPVNDTGSELSVTITLSATCDGSPPLTDSGTTTLTVETIPVHTLIVTAACRPSLVSSGENTNCTASYDDNEGHGVASWSWDDAGAGGAFSPSASVRNPTYTAPDNTSHSIISVALTATAICNGPEPLAESDSASLRVRGGHVFAVTASCDPSTIASGATTSCRATFSDSVEHGAASWSWDDGGAGGAFSPSASVRTPTYTAPAHMGVSDLTIALTVSATCDGINPLSDSDSTTLTVEPATVHTLVVTAGCTPNSVRSEGSTGCTAACGDSYGHGAASWSWDDGGAGGSFLPSASVQDPTYLAPQNIGDADILVTLTVTAVCDGPEPLSDSGSAPLTVRWTILFPDVPNDHWAHDQIAACIHAGIVGGYDDGLYYPNWSVTRDQMAVFISRALVGATVPAGPEEATFDDVPTDHWSFDYVEYCVVTGVVQGFDPVTYGPTVTVSRDSMAVFISRAVAGGDDNVPDAPAEATFDDVPTDHWAYKYVEYCAAGDVVGGYPYPDPDNPGETICLYQPGWTVSRDQMAVFICRAFDLPT